MADQVPTIASFPAGYATLAGCLYAVFTTDRSKWDLVIWSRVSAVFQRGLWWRGEWRVGEGEGYIVRSPKLPLTSKERLVTELSRRITRHARHISGPCARCRNEGAENENDMLHRRLAEWAAALSVVVTAAEEEGKKKGKTHESVKAGNRVPEVTGTTDTIELRPQTPKASASSDQEDRIESTVVNASDMLFIITVKIVGETRAVEEHRIPYSTTWMNSLLSSNPGDPKPQALWQELSTSSTLPAPTNYQVSVQMAANVEILMVEIAFKFLEILFGGAIVLGSTGGAWLGLTLGSLFPTRRAAGIFTSAYGQVDYADISWPKFCKGRFLPVGTVWSKDLDFEIAPRGLTDDVRIALGYLATYIYLTLVQLFKPSLRNVLEFGTYYQTRDAIRWVVLFLQLFVAVFLAREIIREYKMKKLRLGFLLVAIASYLGGNVMVFLAQKMWGPFHLLSKVVDLVAAIGCLAAAAMRKSAEEGLGTARGSPSSVASRNHFDIDVESVGSSSSEIRPEIMRRYAAGSWILMWAIGACTAVY